MSDKKVNISALGQAADTSFGRQSATSGPVLATHSLKSSLLGGDEQPAVRIVYTAIVNMIRDREMIASQSIYEREGDSYIEAATKRIAGDYKLVTDRESSEDKSGDDYKKTIKLERVDVKTTLEVVDLNIYNTKRTVLFRRTATFKVT